MNKGSRRIDRRSFLAGGAAIAAGSALGGPMAKGQTTNAPGVTNTEIKIGQTSPYSGPASNMSTMSRVEAAYISKINAEGGINGRKINLISLDDGYSLAKTVEQTRRLVEEDEVAFLFHSIGTGGATAVAHYLNQEDSERHDRHRFGSIPRPENVALVHWIRRLGRDRGVGVREIRPRAKAQRQGGRPLSKRRFGQAYLKRIFQDLARG